MKLFRGLIGLLIVVSLGSQLLPVRADNAVTCDGVAPLTFKVNDVAKVSENTKLANRIRSSPTLRADITGSMLPGELFIIVNATPACTGDIWWWFIEFRGERGWTAQGADGDMYIEYVTTVTTTSVPANQTVITTVTPTPVAIDNCANAPTPLLEVGGKGTVIDINQEPNIVRNAASIKGKQTFLLPAGAVFEVLRGPVCNDGVYWWRVLYRTTWEVKIGWTAEGLNEERFLAPYKDK